MLQVVGEASPQHFHLHSLQAPYMELPQQALTSRSWADKILEEKTARTAKAIKYLRIGD
jgi:hypothetical protein